MAVREETPTVKAHETLRRYMDKECQYVKALQPVLPFFRHMFYYEVPAAMKVESIKDRNQRVLYSHGNRQEFGWEAEAKPCDLREEFEVQPCAPESQVGADPQAAKLFPDAVIGSRRGPLKVGGTEYTIKWDVKLKDLDSISEQTTLFCPLMNLHMPNRDRWSFFYIGEVAKQKSKLPQSRVLSTNVLVCLGVL
eukprot:CAMPEP_0170637996 /NCGR_PEP_ID=MMETSP0224-20130122/38761_1 /TAXON_ID=285029 /ORGANISM="Togula jolla, Strain CCCM 725" /LENGTH=193 /DNA_ID=CAMNT_0010968017 /DNA_START=201 /DNA_END=779 /DNA_ORIENTATION=-